MGLLGGIAGAIGGIASTILGNNSAKHEAEKNREWQEQMSNTSISRRMADLRNAGLNPLLAVDNVSSGASTPAGSQAQLERFDPSWVTALSSAKVADAQAKNIDADTERIKNDNSLHGLKAEKLELELEMRRQGILTEKTIQELNKANTLEAKSRILVNKAQAEGISMSTEEAKRRIQLLDFDIDSYSNSPYLKNREKYTDIWKGTPYVGPLLGGVEQFLNWSFNSARRFWNDRKNINEGKVRK